MAVPKDHFLDHLLPIQRTLRTPANPLPGMMKKLPSKAASLFFFVALCLQPGQSVQAAGKRIEVPPSGVKVTLIGSPEFVPLIKGQLPKKPRPIVQGEPAPIWIEFETDFDSAEEFPELLFKYSILLKTSGVPKLLEGEVTHIDVAKGKDRHSVMYIAPKTLNRLAEGKAFNPTNILAQWVEVFAGGESIGGNFKSNQGLTYDKVAKDKDKLDRVSDVFVSKAQTPFAPYFWDYYEAVKPLTR